MFPRRHLMLQAYMLADLAIMAGSFGLVIWLHVVQVGEATLSQHMAVRLTATNLLMFAGLLAVWHLILRASGLYRSRRLGRRWNEVLDVLKAVSLGSLVLLAAAITFQIDLVSGRRWFAVAFWATCTVFTATFRIALRLFLERVRQQGRNLRNVLIVGTNERGLQFADDIRKHPELGYQVTGFVDKAWEGMNRFRARGDWKLVAGFDDLPQFVRENVVDEVVLALPVSLLYPHGKSIIELCKEQGIVLRLPSNIFFDIAPAQTRIEMFEQHPVMTLYAGTMEGWPVLVKRAIDFLGAVALLALLAPLFLIVSLLIKRKSPGPVFFVQERVGLNKRRFPLYKFRTMVVDAEAKLKELEDLNEVSGPVFKIARDPRITPLGHFLRRTSIDELPQLFNVLCGDMSLVGPRPLPMRDYQGFSEDWHRRRFSVKPGLTCLWQVSGRSDIPFERWMQLDMDYIDSWSLWLDLKILFRTVPAVLRGSGAA